MADLFPYFLAYAALILLSWHHVNSAKFNTADDLQALLSFRSLISDSSRGILASWNHSINFCKWSGVTCGDQLHPERVTALNLISLGLAGSISPAIANLTFLQRLDLSDNQFHGPIPQQMGRLFQLQYLNLSANSIGGGIPAPLTTRCSKLQVIDLSGNTLSGEIPPFNSSCVDLRIISLRNNLLSGSIPPSLTYLSSLSVLSLGRNQLNGVIPSKLENLYYSLSVLDLSENQLFGGIPSSWGNFSRLTKLDLLNNHLSGDVPTSLWNVSSLSYLSIAYNNLSGFLPSSIGLLALPLLERFDICSNHFHGSIPMALSNASRLEIIDLSNNKLVGVIPPNLGSLKNLQWLNLQNNQLRAKDPNEWSFFTALINCTKLEKLQLDSNYLGGILPNSIANFSSKLQKLTMSDNQISGNISSDIGNLLSLTVLDMGHNLFTGSIPSSTGALLELHVLNLCNNKLSGVIPSTLGNLSQLNSLHLEFNELSGSIQPNIGSCKNLISLDLSYNKLTGSIPKEIFTISTLSIYLGLAHNSLTGEIPQQVGTLINLGVIDVSMNKLSGVLPLSIAACQELEELYINCNFFEGNIYPHLSELTSIEKLDLSQNNLSGIVPNLTHFKFLYYANLSFNNFEGEVPRDGFYANATAFSILGNTRLCGGNPILHLPSCSNPGKHHSFFTHVVFIFAVVTVTTAFLFSFFLFTYIKIKSRMKIVEKEYKIAKKEIAKIPYREMHRYAPRIEPRYKHVRISYAELVRATNGFSSDNIIGMGSYGVVYKGILDDDHNFGFSRFAVKVINLQQKGASRSFNTECDALRNIKHRNIVKLYSSCSGVDSMGNEFKAIIFELMSKGSLSDWLHPNDFLQDKPKLNLIQKVNIAINVASALEYLHHHGEKPIIHCDIKPSNILLDDDMTAHITDFGLSRVPMMEPLFKSSLRLTVTSIACMGTTGYVAPEYGMANRASIKGDVYSYGILLLEMFTGKRPTDDTVTNYQSLHNYVDMSFDNQILEVMEAHLVPSEANKENIEKCVSTLLRIGLLCSHKSPSSRPAMGDIIKVLLSIRRSLEQ